MDGSCYSYWWLYELGRIVILQALRGCIALRTMILPLAVTYITRLG